MHNPPNIHPQLCPPPSGGRPLKARDHRKDGNLHGTGRQDQEPREGGGSFPGRFPGSFSGSFSGRRRRRRRRSSRPRSSRERSSRRPPLPQYPYVREAEGDEGTCAVDGAARRDPLPELEVWVGGRSTDGADRRDQKQRWKFAVDRVRSSLLPVPLNHAPSPAIKPRACWEKNVMPFVSICRIEIHDGST